MGDEAMKVSVGVVAVVVCGVACGSGDDTDGESTMAGTAGAGGQGGAGLAVCGSTLGVSAMAPVPLTASDGGSTYGANAQVSDQPLWFGLKLALPTPDATLDLGGLTSPDEVVELTTCAVLSCEGSAFSYLRCDGQQRDIDGYSQACCGTMVFDVGYTCPSGSVDVLLRVSRGSLDRPGAGGSGGADQSCADVDGYVFVR